MSLERECVGIVLYSVLKTIDIYTIKIMESVCVCVCVCVCPAMHFVML